MQYRAGLDFSKVLYLSLLGFLLTASQRVELHSLAGINHVKKIQTHPVTHQLLTLSQHHLS
jgi:hypothetical protein